jgi:DNA-binding IclR family transcriptional regulator
MRHPSPVPGTKALHRALGILQAFTDANPTWSLTALAKNVGLNKTTTHRILSALEQSGFVTRTPEGNEYQLGPELIVLGARALSSIDVREVARPELQALAKETGDDVTLERLSGWDVMLLHEEHGQSLLYLGSPVGTLWPAHATATGKVLHANAEEPAEEPPGGLVACTDNTIVSWEGWNTALAEVRESGFATNIEELELGYNAVAAPVRDRHGHAVAAISIGGALHRIGKDRIPELVDLVRMAASRVSARLGHGTAIEEIMSASVPELP